MPLTNFPNGASSFGIPQVGSEIPSNITGSVNGNYWFVNSASGSASFPGTSPDQAFALLSTAIAAAAVNDIIIVAAGHAETIITATALDFSVAGLQVVGLGEGAKRPTITLGTATTATITVSGASVSIGNIISVNNIDQVASTWTITGASCTLGLPGAPVEIQDAATNKEAVIGVTVTGAKFTSNLVYKGQTGGSHCTRGIALNGVTGALINADFYGKASTAWVNFITTLSTNVEVYGYMYNSGTTNYTKDVVDTIGSSTWFASFYDGSAGYAVSGGSGTALGPAAAATVIADLGVPTANTTANLLERDLIGNKTDTAVTAVGTDKTINAYVKGLVTMATVIGANSTNNAFAGDVIGNKTDTSVYVAGTTNSLAAYIKGIADIQERVAVSATAILADGTTIFTVAGGPIQVLSLISECVVGGDSAASTVQYSATATGLSAQTISAASGSVANAAAHATVSLIGTALSTAAVYNSKGTNLGMTPPGGVVVNVGIMTTVIGTANTTTGTWRHIMRYRPLTSGVTVS